jgi:ammonia channel protein AmtB
MSQHVPCASCRGVVYDQGVVYGGNGKLLGIQIFGVLVLVAWSAIINLPLFFGLRYFNVLRIPLDAQLSVHVRCPPLLQPLRLHI